MAGMCCGINVPESEPTSPVEASARTTRRRRIQLRQLRVISDKGDKQVKRQKVMSEPNGEDNTSDDLNQPARECPNAIENSSLPVAEEVPKYGFTSVCGKRRDMEDAVSICPSFCRKNERNGKDGCEKLDFYGVFDGHGCSHVAKKCKERMHEIIREEVESGDSEWKYTMTRSYIRMDKEVTERATTTTSPAVACRCELQSPQCDAVGSTAVVAVVTPDKIVISNCGDSRAVICRNGVAISLTSDHKPDRPDELSRIEEAGGRVIYWDGPRVLGMLAMSRAIGDNYLKPYVIPDPEVTVMDRTSEDECLILASDGLWDVMSNHTAVSVARMCLKAKRPPSPPRSPPGNDGVMGDVGEGSDKACSEASILLTKLALARRSCDNVSVVVVDLRRNGL